MKKEKSDLEKDLDYYKRKSEWFSKIIAKYQEEENKHLKYIKRLETDYKYGIPMCILLWIMIWMIISLMIYA